MIVVDLTGDGRNDIIWGNGHNFGLWWEERRDDSKDGSTNWQYLANWSSGTASSGARASSVLSVAGCSTGTPRASASRLTGGGIVASEWDFTDPYTVRADLRRGPREVDLVVDDDPRQAPRQPREDRFVRRRDADGPIAGDDHAVGTEGHRRPDDGAEVLRVLHPIENHQQRRLLPFRCASENRLFRLVGFRRRKGDDALVPAPAGHALQARRGHAHQPRARALDRGGEVLGARVLARFVQEDLEHRFRVRAQPREQLHAVEPLHAKVGQHEVRVPVPVEVPRDAAAPAAVPREGGRGRGVLESSAPRVAEEDRLGFAVLLQQIGGFLGILWLSWVAGRFGRKPAMAMAMICGCAGAVFVFTFFSDKSQIIWLWPLLGFFFMPYTTLAYMAAMLNNARHVDGLWLALVIFLRPSSVESWSSMGRDTLVSTSEGPAPS